MLLGGCGISSLRDSRRSSARRPDSSREPSYAESLPSPHVSLSGVTSHSPRRDASQQAKAPRRWAIRSVLSRDSRRLRATGGLRLLSNNKIAFAEHGDDGEAETRRPLRDSRNLKSDRCRPDRRRLAPPRLPTSDSSAFSAAGLPVHDAQVARPEAGAPLPRSAPHVGKRQDTRDGPTGQIATDCHARCRCSHPTGPPPLPTVRSGRSSRRRGRASQGPQTSCARDRRRTSRHPQGRRR